MESSKTLDDLNPLGLMMYDDFIRRVHKCRTNPKLSRPVQQCVDYIEMHLDQKIRAADLASAETGFCINDYIKRVNSFKQTRWAAKRSLCRPSFFIAALLHFLLRSFSKEVW